jgi:hypothetical protein
MPDTNTGLSTGKTALSQDFPDMAAISSTLGVGRFRSNVTHRDLRRWLKMLQAPLSSVSGNASNSPKVHLKHDLDFLNHFHRLGDK